jgi:hypothetical protein
LDDARATMGAESCKEERVEGRLWEELRKELRVGCGLGLGGRVVGGK